MNPFLHSTVAEPQSDAMASWRAPCRVAPASGPGRRRVRLASTAGALALGAGLGLASLAAHAVDVNTASLAELEGLRGVGPKTARIILEERQRAGRFESLEDLSDRVRGIGPKRVQALQAAGLTVEAAKPSAAAAAAKSSAAKPAPRPAAQR